MAWGLRHVRKRWTDTSGADRHHSDREAFFAGMRFQRRDTISVETEQTIPVERLIDRVLSMSSSSLDRVGDDRQALSAALQEVLASFAMNNLIRERLKLGRRYLRAGLGKRHVRLAEVRQSAPNARSRFSSMGLARLRLLTCTLETRSTIYFGFRQHGGHSIVVRSRLRQASPMF